MAAAPSPFLARQRRFFGEPDVGHFLWQTQNPYFARTERDLLAGFPMRPAQAVLEVGCGEGGNLVNLLAQADGESRPRLLVGLDLVQAKLGFARAQGVPGRLVCGDALALPFGPGAFDLVLCRDLLHHLEQRDRAVRELRRVLKPGGVLWIVEPNGKNPLIRLHALLRPHERGQLQNSVEGIRTLVARHFPAVAIEVRQPLPVWRLLLHHRFGCPWLGSWRAFAAVMDLWQRLCRALLPPRLWSYIIARAERDPG